jgi:hypothetical protein
MYVIAWSAVPNSQNILTTGMKLQFWLSGTADRVVWAVSSKEIFRKDPSSGFSVGRSIDSILSEIDQKWNITKLLNTLIQSNL